MFSENLKTLRKAKGLSQEELAIRLNVVRQTISKWEKGLSVPDADLLIQIADILEVSVTELLGARIENEQELNAVAEQLSRINEQLAIKNRRASRIWKGILIVFVAFLLMGALLVILSLAPFYAFRDGEVRTTANVQEIGIVLSAPDINPVSIMYDDVLYISTGRIIDEVIDVSNIIGHILSIVPLSDWPAEHAQTNFEPLYGAPIAAYDDGLAVLFRRGNESRWLLFQSQDIVLAETIDGGLRLGRYYSEDGMSWVYLVDSNLFRFNRHMAMSYVPSGVFVVSDGRLILNPGGNEEYIFIITNEGLALELESTYIEGVLERGEIFVYSD